MVIENQIPDDLQQLILSSCPSVPHLEALLLLRGNAERTWNPATMAQRLYIDEPSAARVLRDLVASELVAVDDTAELYRYAPRSPAVSKLVDRLADLHSRALIAVTQLIHRRSAQLFADAFKLRKS